MRLKSARLKSACLVLLCLVMLLALLRGRPAPMATTDNRDLRAPFALELPDLNGMIITAPEAGIPSASLHTLRLRVRKPFADAISYGKIYTKINGESAGTIQDIRSGSDGYIVNCDLDRKPRFRLQPGKNVVEIYAVDRSGQNYYASYVLLAGGRPAGDATLSATVENIPLTSGSDVKPPVVYLTAPKGIVPATGPLTVRGVVTDDSGKIASVTVNGQAATLSSSAVTRDFGLEKDNSPGFSFERAITVPPAAASIIVEAKDAAGNLARLTIPVRKREAVASAQFRGRKFAVIVGVSKYKYADDRLKNLAYADADARAFRDFLLQPEGGSFTANNILYLENEQATLDGVRGALTSFLAKPAADDLVLFYLAGHGGPDPYSPQNLYYLLHDSKLSDMVGSALPMTELQEAIEHGMRAQRILVFVDTCHSAGLTGEKIAGTRGLENNLVNLYASKLFNETGRAVLTAADVNELSQESKRWGEGHGVFTWAVLEGLRGGADANGDKYITAGELFAYVSNRVRFETGFKQNPRALPGLNTELTLAFVKK